MPHEQLLWQAPGFLVSFCSARGEHTKGRGSLLDLLFSPPVCVRARPRNLALCTKKKLVCEARAGGGAPHFGFQVCFWLVQLLKNNSFFSKFELPTVEPLLKGHLGTDGEMAVEKRFK